MSEQNNLPTNPTTPLPPTPPVPPAPPAPPAPQQAYPTQTISPYPQQDASAAPTPEDTKAGAFYDTMKKAGAKAKAMGAEQAERLKEANAQRKLQAAATGDQGLESAGFFKALFDLNFHNFITVKFAKLIYLIWILCIGLTIGIVALSVLGYFISEGSFGFGLVMAVLTLIAGSILGLIQLILVRLGIEMAVALIRTAENTSHLRRQQAETNTLLHQNQ